MSELLENKDLTVIIDKSGSMFSKDMGDKTRWEAAQESTFALASKAAKFDPDGITLYTFSSNHKRFDNVELDAVNKVFESDPSGTTNLGPCLADAFSNYFERKKMGKGKTGEIFIVITDGAPDSQKSVEQAIVEASKQVDHDKEIGVTFVQVGHDNGATRFLEHLDDNLTNVGAKYDIVDTIKIADIDDKPLTEVLLNALTD
jgi:uncharacterized protein with von Willebrand factor type A (vWA) domain